MEKFTDKIMIVDDSSPFIRLIIESMIDAKNKNIIDNIIFCQDVDCALKQYVIHHPLIVLMDLKMPVKNGVEGAQLLREIDPNVCIYFLTNFPSDPEASKAISDHLVEGALDKSVGVNAITGIITFIIKMAMKVV